MSGSIHVSAVIPEAMLDIAQRIAERRHLEGLFDRIDQARARIAELHRELGPEAEAETRGAPQSQVDITR